MATTAWGLILVCYFFMPEPGAELANRLAPTNINYVYGFSDTTTQTWMPRNLYVLTLMAALFGVVYLPTHFVLKLAFRKPQPARSRPI